MKSLTYEGWKEIGYHVIKGEKATGKTTNGVPTFTRDQVEDTAGFDFSPREES